MEREDLSSWGIAYILCRNRLFKSKYFLLCIGIYSMEQVFLWLQLVSNLP
jgi:hypothetical protein